MAATAKARVQRIAVDVPYADVSARVVRGVGFRFVCSCGLSGSRRATWADARADMLEHVAEHAEG